MSTKQVKGAAPVAPPAATSAVNGNSRNLYMSVDTFNSEGKTIGGRIVDLYHFGTRSWLQTHCWWAMHNGHTVEINVATDEQISDYTAAGTQALAAKFNDTVEVAPVAAPAEPVEAAA